MYFAVDDDHAQEACGIFGIYGVPDAAVLIHGGLFSLQHRGQEGAGIVVSDGTKISSHKGMGLVNEVFTPAILEQLKGHIGIGHVRYSTTGSDRIQNVQPLVAECVDGIWAIAHNGNLVNAKTLRQKYQEGGAIFQTGTDSEVLVHLLADPYFRSRPRRVARALLELKGAFAFLLMNKDVLMAVRDPLGFKPLSIGRLEKGYIIASETCALAQAGATYERDVEPGELVVVDERGLHSTFFSDQEHRHFAQCVFEHVYFARPDSLIFGENVHSIRLKLGRRLAEEHPVEADVVIPVPDSGNSAALGFSHRSGIPLDSGFMRNHYVGRTFIMPETIARGKSVDMKLAVVADVVRGKRVVVVDDSIIRGTTSQRRIAALREAGAREIHMRISCPPTAHPCFFGIDFSTKEELVASGRTSAEVGRLIGADSLGYLSIEGLLSPFRSAQHFCIACFSGDYPMDVSKAQSKKSLETMAPMFNFESAATSSKS